jgi:hypothetical protein
MRPAALTLLAAVTACAAAAAVAVTALDRTPAPPERAGETVFPGLREALPGVTAVRIETPQIVFTVSPDDGDDSASGESGDRVWRVAERDGWPADMRKLAETLFALSDLTYVEPKTADPARYARLEIEDPAQDGARARRVTVTGPGGETLADLIAGRRTFDLSAGTTTRGLYIRKPGEARGWLAAGGLGVSDDAQSWLQSDLLAIAPERLYRVAVVHRDGDRVEIVRADDGDGFVAPGLGAEPQSPRDLTNVAGALENLDLADVGRLSDIAFDGGNTVETTAETLDGLVLTFTILTEARDDPDAKPRRWARIAARADGGADTAVRDEAQALSEKTDGRVFLLPDWEAGRLTVRRADLVSDDTQ